MEIQAHKTVLNPALERKRAALNPTLDRKPTAFKEGLDREMALNPTLERNDPNTTSEDAKLREACREMETYFLGHLLKSMRSTVQSSDLFGSEKQESVFRDMLDDEFAKASSQRGIGIADMLYNQLSRSEIQAQLAQKPLKVDGTTVDK